jgi:hypothetical protein
MDERHQTNDQAAAGGAGHCIFRVGGMTDLAIV